MAYLSPMQIIAFDADDTLWVNETFFRAAEERFFALLADYAIPHNLQKELLQIEIANLPLYGFGIKGFMLSMIETARRITDGKVSDRVLGEILTIGKEMLQAPVELLPGIREVLEALAPKYRLVLATKGDLLDQERKLDKSGLDRYFHHVEVMSDKQPANYAKLIRHLDIPATAFTMIGNSLKSDILPVLELGGRAFHIPFHTTWAYEHHAAPVAHERLVVLKSAQELLPYLSGS